jgi:hypothetical protein
MLDEGPLVGMVQIPGIKYGVKDVVALATLNSAIERVLETLRSVGVQSLDEQTTFLARCLDAWLEASGRKHDIAESAQLDPENVAYQGRILVSAIDLISAYVWRIRKSDTPLNSLEAQELLVPYIERLLNRAGLSKNGKFIPKSDFKRKGFLGSGGIGRFRDTLWAATIGTKSIADLSPEDKAELANKNRATIASRLANQ